METTIRLVCPVCKGANEILRQSFDPPNATEIWIPHDACAGEGSNITYHDAEGRELNGDPESPDFGAVLALLDVETQE